MGFLSSIKKLFGFGSENVESQEVSSSDVILESEPVVIEEVKTESFNTPIYTKVETVEETAVEEATTVKEIKSKARKPQSNSEEAKASSEKPKKPYRRPRPKKNKPTE